METDRFNDNLERKSDDENLEKTRFNDDFGT